MFFCVNLSQLLNRETYKFPARKAKKKKKETNEIDDDFGNVSFVSSSVRVDEKLGRMPASH